MTAGVFAMVLCAAVLHAAWNAMIKVSGDRVVVLAVMMAAQAVFALAALAFVPVPPWSVWPFILFSTVFHTGYFLLLTAAYRVGDLSHVYPVSRGVAPLVVAAGAALAAGETLGPQATIALMLIVAGIASVAVARGKPVLEDRLALIYALGTGLCIAGYTLVDGLGAREAGGAASYILWLNLFNGLPIIALALALRRGAQRRLDGSAWRMGALSGVVSLAAYWIVLWAMTQAPLALVSAVRESSIVFALLFGVFFLKERLDLRKTVSIFLTVAGTALLKISR
ncbi:MAG: DMT family transporter [Alphaproteobacteria bacterium]|nr:DMT family transporter [Alphaproteobacteria bacterium]